MIDEYSAKRLVFFPAKNSHYYNYTTDSKFKILIFKNKIILEQKRLKKFEKVLISEDKNLIKRWLKINNYIIKNNSNPNFKLYYCIQVI